MAIVGRAQVLVAPSFTGFQQAVGSQVTKTMPAAGKQAGTAMATGMSSGIASSAGTVTTTAGRIGTSVSKTVASAGTLAGGGFVSRFGAALGPMAGVLGAAGVVSFFKGAVDEASGLGESLNALNVTYGENATGIARLGEQAATSLGLSNLEFNNLAVRFSGFADTIAGEGGNVVGTLDELTGRASDFASVMNLDVAEAAQLFQSGLAGETEPLRQFGIDMSAAAVESYALANGIATSGAEMTEQQKVQARYGLLMEQTAKSQGDFANTSDSLANQQRILSSRFADLRAEIGVKVMPALSGLAAWMLETGLPALKDLAGWVSQNSDALTALAVGAGVAVTALLAFKVFNTVKTWIMGTTLATHGLNAALRANPIGLVITGLGLLVAAFVYAWKNSETFRKIVTGAWDGIRKGWDALAAGVKWVWDRVLKPVFQAVAGFVTDKVAPGIRKGVDIVKRVWEGLKEAFAAPVRWVLDVVWNNGIKKAFDNVAKAVGSDARLPTATLAGAGGGRGSGSAGGRGAVQARRKGGPVRPGEPYVVGEEGPELVVPERAGWVLTASQTRRVQDSWSDRNPPHGAGFWDQAGALWSRTWRGAVSWVRGALSSAAGALLNPVRGLMSSTLGNAGTFGALVSDMGGNAIDRVLEWVRGQDTMPTEDPKGRSLRGAKPHVNAAAWGIADQFGGVRLMQAFNQSMAGGHPKGLAVDFIDSVSKLDRIASYGAKNFSRLGLDYIAWQGQLFSGSGWRPQTVGYGNDPYHRWHTHFEFEPARVYDGGGDLRYGDVAVSLSRKPEVVLTNQVISDLHRAVSGSAAAGRRFPEYVSLLDEDGSIMGRMRVVADDQVEAGFRRQAKWPDPR